MTTTLEAPVQVAAAPSPRRWLGLFAILTATLMNLLDTSIVNVALPVIRRDLGGSYATMQWIAASYTLVLAIGLLTGGRLGDMFGRRRMLLSGAAGFVAASLFCALAWSPEALIAGRVLQAVFGAVMVPQGFGLIRDLFPGPDMGKAYGVFGPSIGLATILGPIVAGGLIKLDPFGTDWRSIFLINLPMGAFTIAAGLKALPASSGDRSRKIDILGVLIAGTGMGLLVYPLMQGRELGWPGWIFGMLAAAVAVLAVFVVQQLGRKSSPLVEMSVFKRRSYASGVVFIVAFFVAIIGFSIAAGFLLQLGLGYTPMGASVAMAPWAIGAFVGSAAGAMAPQLGRKALHIGLAVMGAGIAAVYAVFQVAGVDVSPWALAVPFLIAGAGMGMIFVPLFGIILGEIEDHEVGSASGALESIQQLSSALGVAVLGTVFFNRFAIAGRPDVNALAATQQVTLIALVLVAVAFGIGFLLPKRGR
ncbi:MFS transporter [Streptosporangiaceae bacterium NEAU-GS5]|nr:MFS transporter [Streptosporangiaceae bacterium NEAU-GS5]